MKSLSLKSVFRQYYLRCLLILAFYIAIVALCIGFWPNIWSFLFCTILFPLMKIFVRIAANKTFSPILFDDLNAQRYQEIIYGNKHFVPPLAYRINAAFSTGDYQTIVNIASLQIQKKNCSVRSQSYYLNLLASVYFHLRDFENLKVVLAKCEELKAQHPKKIRPTPYSAKSYYRYFLKQNYEACKTVCTEWILGMNPKAWDYKIRKLQYDFFFAIACYENGDKNEARDVFEAIISYAPQMYYAIASKKYLEAIEDGQAPVMSSVEILPNNGCPTYDKTPVLKLERYRKIKRICIVITAILILIRIGLELV